MAVKVSPVGFSNITPMKAMKQFIVAGIISISAFTAASAQNCQAGFTYTVNNGTVQFTNTSVGSLGQPFYYWNFGNNTNSTAVNPVASYNNNGMYMVCLTMIDSNTFGGYTSTFCDTIAITNTPCNGLMLTGSFTSESVCNACDGIASVTAYGGTPPYTYAWSNGGTTATMNGVCSGTYSVVVTDAIGCITSANGTVGCVPNSNCQASFTYTVNNGTVQFTNTSTGSSNTPFYNWTFGNNTSSNLVNPTQSFSNGTYVVCLSMIDSSMFNNCFSYFCDTIVITNSVCNGFSAAVATTDESVCGACDGTANVTASGGTSPYTYTWSNNATSPSLGNLCSSMYNVVVTDANGCIANASGIVSCIPNQNCQASFTYSVSGNVVSFTNTSTGLNNFGSNYSWSYGDNTFSYGPFPAPHTYTANGTYMVCLTLSDSMQNCTSTYCDTITITGQQNNCSSYFSLIQDSVNTLLWYAYPAVTGTAPFTYLWDFGDGNQSTQASPSHTYATPGQYTLCLTITDANGCSSTYCDSSSVRAMQLAMQYLQVMPFTTGIQEHENLAGKVAPSPADQFIDITLEKETKGTVRITDMLGNTLLENTMQGRSFRMDISMLPAGYYTVSVLTANGGMNKKVAIVRQ